LESTWGASRVEAPDVCPFCPAVPPSAHLSLPPPPYSAGQARPRRTRRGQRRDEAARRRWPVTVRASGGGGGGQARRRRAARACARACAGGCGVGQGVSVGAAVAGGRGGRVRRRCGCGRVPAGAARVWGLVGERVWAWACEWVWYVSEASCGTRCARGTGRARAVVHGGHAGRQFEVRLGGLVTRTAGRSNRAVVGGEGACAAWCGGAEKWTPGAASRKVGTPPYLVAPQLWRRLPYDGREARRDLRMV
jgi:hypothetical protein